MPGLRLQRAATVWPERIQPRIRNRIFLLYSGPKPKRPGSAAHATAKVSQKLRTAAPDTGETQQRIKVTGSHIEVFNTFKNIEPIFGVSCWQFKGKAAASEFWTAVSNMPVYRNLAEEARLKSARKTLNDLGYDRISKVADE